MPALSRPDGASIQYETQGSGQPVLLLGPGLTTAADAAWSSTKFDPWTVLDGFTLISMNQRHCGSSTGALTPFSYEQAADDQLAVLDELGADRVYVLGEAFGASLAWALMRRAPERVSAAVCLRPPGVCAPANKHADFLGLFDDTMRVARAQGMTGVIAAADQDLPFEDCPEAGPFADRIRTDPAFREHLRLRPVEIYNALMVRYRDGLWPAGRPLFSVTLDWLAECPVPQLVAGGNDRYHPDVLARLILDLTPRASRLAAGDVDAEVIREFLAQHAAVPAEPASPARAGGLA